MFFQNPFANDFEGMLLLGDRQFNMTFRVPGNRGRGDEYIYSWTSGPYDLSGNDVDGNSRDTLVLNYSLMDNDDYKNWAVLSVDITASASSSAAVTIPEIITALNANTTFTGYFEAEEKPDNRLLIKQKLPITRMKFYVSNGRAEEALSFNARSGVAEIPSYFERHTIANRFNFTDSLKTLIALDPSTYDVDVAVIDNAVNGKGVSLDLDSSTVKDDYQLFRGRSGLFQFQKITVDGTDRITQIIEYPAGAVAGDLARKITYTYTSTNTKPDEIFEVPYTLASGDLITP